MIGIQNPNSTDKDRNPESKTVLDSLTWSDKSQNKYWTGFRMKNYTDLRDCSVPKMLL